MARDFTTHPYSPEEARVADYIAEATKRIAGGGDDPIGFLIGSHAFLASMIRVPDTRR